MSPSPLLGASDSSATRRVCPRFPFFRPQRVHCRQTPPQLPFPLVLGGGSEMVLVGPDYVWPFHSYSDPRCRLEQSFVSFPVRVSTCGFPTGPVPQEGSGSFREMIHALYQVNVLTTGKEGGCILLLLLLFVMENFKVIYKYAECKFTKQSLYCKRIYYPVSYARYVLPV